MGDFTTDTARIKKVLHGASKNRAANCAVAVLVAPTAVVTAHRTTSAKKLSVDLKTAAQDAGAQVRTICFGQVHGDRFPGGAVFELNKSPSHLKQKLRLALRGSGYGKVEMSGAEDAATRTAAMRSPERNGPQRDARRQDGLDLK